MRRHTRGAAPAGSPLQIYMREVEGTPLLSAAQERELTERLAAGDRSAFDPLAQANLRLVVGIARGFLGRGVELDDLIAEGNLGLIRAIEKFDPRIGVRFSTYATYWIREAVLRAVMTHGRAIRLPAYILRLLPKWRRASDALAERLGRDPTPEEVGRELRLPKKQAATLAEAARIGDRKHAAGPQDEDLPLEELLVDERTIPPEEQLIEADERRRVADCLGRLTDREAAVIRMRFGLGTHEAMTLREVAQALGMSHQGVQQAEGRALRRLLTGAPAPPPRREATNGTARDGDGKPPGRETGRRPGADGAPAESGSDRPVPDNRALLLRTGDDDAKTCPAWFVALGDRGAVVVALGHPAPGERVAVCLTDPVPTGWSPATVAGVEAEGGGPNRIALEFAGGSPRRLREALRPGGTAAPLRGGATAAVVGPARLLIVEDHEATRLALRSLFLRNGYEVATAATVAEGMTQLDPPPSYIVLDLMLPDGEGEAILRKVRAENLPSRVAVCTGTEDPGRLDSVRRLEPQALLRKPLEPEELVRACSATAG